MAMAQAEAAQPTELQPTSDTGQNLLPEGYEVAELLRGTFNTVRSVWADITGNKPDTVVNAASLVVNGKAPFETVSGQLTDLSKQGKLSDLSTYFDAHYSTGLRDQLAQNYPGREAEIDKLLGNGPADKPDPMLGGLSREQLKSVFDKFPELKGVISGPEVLGAMIQNEKDHTNNDGWIPDDSIIDGVLRGATRFLGDGTEFVSKWNPAEIKAKAEKSGGVRGFFERIGASIEAGIKDRILRTSIGDGQVQIRNIVALQDQERVAGREVPTISSSLTKEGSAQLVAAYFAKSIQMLNDRTITSTEPGVNPFMRNSESVKAGFAKAQELWDEGKATGNQELMQRAVMMTYNPGINAQHPHSWTPERILKHYLGR